MLDNILDFFVGSIPNDEHNLVKRWLWTSFITEFCILIVFTLIVFFLNLPADIYIFIGIFLAILLAVSLLLYRNHLRLTCLLFCVGTITELFFADYRFGGIRSPIFTAFVIPIIIAAIFLRGRSAIIITFISGVAGLLLLLIELNRSYLPDPIFTTAPATWILDVMVFIMTASLLGIATRQIRSSLHKANLEVEERRRAENALRRQTEYLTALHETALSITNRIDPLALLDSILIKTEEILETRHGAIDLTLPEGDGIQQKIGHGFFAAFHDQIVPAGQGVTGTALMTGKTIVVDDYQTFAFANPMFIQAGLRVIACIPMILREQVIGVVSLAHIEAGRKFTPDQIELLERFAELIGVALDNVRLYQDAQKELAERRLTEDALLDSKERLRLALDAAHMGIWDWDIRSGRIHWSEQVYNIFSGSSKAFSGSYENFISLIHPLDRKKVIQLINESLNEPEKTFQVEFRVSWQNQTVHWLEERGRVYSDASGNRSYMSGTVTDITERKTAEEKLTGANKNLERYTAVLEQRSGQLKVAAEVSRAASEILDPTQLGQLVVDLVCERCHIYYAGLFLVDDKFEWAILTGASGEAGKQMLANGHKLKIGNTSMVGWCIFNRQPRIALDVGEDSVQVINPLLSETRSELALPLITRGQTIGALNIQTNKKAAFGKEEISIFQTMAGQLATAILNARLYAQLQLELEERKRIEEKIRKLNAELEERVQRRTRDLRDSEEKFRALTENNPLEITRYDYDGCYLYVNRPTYDFDKVLKPEDLIGKTIRQVMGDTAFVDFAERSIHQVFETGQPLKTEYELGAEYAAWWLAPEYGPDGKVLSVIASTMNITERKRMEEELQQRSTELQATNKELEAFSYSISHDLRAPLRAIDGFARIIAEDFKETFPAEAAPYFQHISDASTQMGQLIDDLLRLSRVTRVELRLFPVNLSELAASLISDLQSREPTRQIKVTIEDGLVTTGDERLLRVALENLLSNAWKFTGKVKDAHIQVGQTIKDDKNVFYIKDNGIGFDMAYAEKLFGAFQRLHSVDEFPGTGIGLAIVQRVINKHGGQIWVESEPNKGATFYFTL
ncbi:MAG: GAF domain-containing protein [Anaerolineales bacterium]